MKKQVIIIILLAFALVLATGAKKAYLVSFSREDASALMALYWLTWAILVIMLGNLCWSWILSRKCPEKSQHPDTWFNRRQCYRVLYPSGMRPSLVLTAADNQIARPLEFTVLDICENGLCFVDDGSLGMLKTFSGRLRFQHGETIPITGRVVRRTDARVQVKLKTQIGYDIILREQRHLIASAKTI